MESTPFYTKSVNPALRSLSKMYGYRVEFEGLENLKLLDLSIQSKRAEKGRRGHRHVNIFMPSHRHDRIDAYVMANLNLPHSLIFGNASVYPIAEEEKQLLANQAGFMSSGPFKGISGSLY